MRRAGGRKKIPTRHYSKMDYPKDLNSPSISTAMIYPPAPLLEIIAQIWFSAPFTCLNLGGCLSGFSLDCTVNVNALAAGINGEAAFVGPISFPSPLIWDWDDMRTFVNRITNKYTIKLCVLNRAGLFFEDLGICKCTVYKCQLRVLGPKKKKP